MVIQTTNMIYMGNAADVDTIETNLIAENPGDLVGLTKSGWSDGITQLSANNADGDVN